MPLAEQLTGVEHLRNLAYPTYPTHLTYLPNRSSHHLT